MKHRIILTFFILFFLLPFAFLSCLPGNKTEDISDFSTGVNIDQTGTLTVQKDLLGYWLNRVEGNESQLFNFKEDLLEVFPIQEGQENTYKRTDRYQYQIVDVPEQPCDCWILSLVNADNESHRTWLIIFKPGRKTALIGIPDWEEREDYRKIGTRLEDLAAEGIILEL